MGVFARLGNDLYSGRRSVDFVGRWRTWFVVSAVDHGGRYRRPRVAWPRHGIEFVGGAEYSVALDPDMVNQDTADEIRESVAGTGIENASSPW